MESALESVLHEARHRGATRVHAVTLRIGSLSGVVPDALRFAFEALVPGTKAEGASLSIEEVPARFWCSGCSREFEAADLLSECPGCGNCSTDLRAGREMEVSSMEIE